MNREAILEILSGAGHGAHADAVAALLQPAFRIVATKLADEPRGDADAEAAFEQAMAALPLGASRFGGVPDLPPGATWPERDGVPMEFIAQIRLADAAGDDRLPARGSLLFFYNSQWGSSDMNPDAACCAVLHHDGPDEALVRATPPRVEWQSELTDEPQLAPRLHGLASLALVPTLTVPGGVSPYVTGPLETIWQDFTADHDAELVGGAGYRNLLLGYVDNPDYVGAHQHGTDDQLLLRVDSDPAAGFQFGDCDALYFMIAKPELAARDFTKVRLYSILG